MLEYKSQRVFFDMPPVSRQVKYLKTIMTTASSDAVVVFLLASVI